MKRSDKIRINTSNTVHVLQIKNKTTTKNSVRFINKTTLTSFDPDFRAFASF